MLVESSQSQTFGHELRLFAGPSEWFSQKSHPSSLGHNFLADAAAKAMPAVVNINSNNSSAREEVQTLALYQDVLTENRTEIFGDSVCQVLLIYMYIRIYIS